MPMPRAAATRVEELVEDPARALRDPEYLNESVCRRWLHRVDDLVHEDHRKARAAGVLGVRLAHRIVRKQAGKGFRRRCILALSFAVLGSVHRSMGNLDKAERLLIKAEGLSNRCRDGNVLAEIHLRRGFVRMYQTQLDDGSYDPSRMGTALESMEKAVRMATARLTTARTFNARGLALVLSGDWHGGKRDARAALALIDPKIRPFDHAASLSLLVHALTVSGDRTAQQEAVAHLETLCDDLPPRAPEFRARILWAAALLVIPDRRRKGRARRLLDQARKRFIALGMRSEAAAVTAELARLKPEGAVPELAAELLAILDPGPIYDIVKRLRDVRMVERVDVAEDLRRMIIGPGVLPSAAFPPP